MQSIEPSLTEHSMLLAEEAAFGGPVTTAQTRIYGGRGESFGWRRSPRCCVAPNCSIVLGSSMRVSNRTWRTLISASGQQRKGMVDCTCLRRSPTTRAAALLGHGIRKRFEELPAISSYLSRNIILRTGSFDMDGRYWWAKASGGWWQSATKLGCLTFAANGRDYDCFVRCGGSRGLRKTAIPVESSRKANRNCGSSNTRPGR